MLRTSLICSIITFHISIQLRYLPHLHLFFFYLDHGTFKARAIPGEHVVPCLKVEEELKTFKWVTPPGTMAHAKARIIMYGTCLVVWSLDKKENFLLKTWAGLLREVTLLSLWQVGCLVDTQSTLVGLGSMEHYKLTPLTRENKRQDSEERRTEKCKDSGPWERREGKCRWWASWIIPSGLSYSLRGCQEYVGCWGLVVESSPRDCPWLKGAA